MTVSRVEVEVEHVGSIPEKHDDCKRSKGDGARKAMGLSDVAEEKEELVQAAAMRNLVGS